MRLTPKQASVVKNLIAEHTGEAIGFLRGDGRDVVVEFSSGDWFVVGGRGALKGAS
jgi:hypothetical protein